MTSIKNIENMDLNCYLDKHCQFKLESGKSVFGVVWRIFSDGVEHLVFSSSVEYKKLKDKEDVLIKMKDQLNLIDSEKIIFAQQLETA
jgi:hypothetical protein